MNHPQKWRDTTDPWQLPFRNFTLTEVIGYPHAGNDVFQVKGIFQGNPTDAYIKVARQTGADIDNEINTIRLLNCPLAPEILDCDEHGHHFLVTAAKQGERLSVILKDKPGTASLTYLFEYGYTLGWLHNQTGNFPKVKDRRFFHIPDKFFFTSNSIEFVYNYLVINQPKTINCCFCHGDFHYANLLWHDHHLSAILDFELSGMGSKEFDIAWALIRRPGQNFLHSKTEIERFLDGYTAVNTCTPEYVAYYMILIYAYFYQIGKDDPEYRKYIMKVFHEVCLRNA